ncbi:hypothetical protein [Azospirillum sp. SYSU D00513]|uniref:hypothetical protein n=1 Tax=Azospirillum sp. SYSU D00513 TaxID=2812561 RepID=UPI001A9687F6|nr:hypothetical protein [Azospirillum sp. SYSU D00513]
MSPPPRSPMQPRPNRGMPSKASASPTPRGRERNLGDDALAALDDPRSRAAAMAVIEEAARTDADERRRFASAASRVTGASGPNALLAAARIYVADLWALAGLGEGMAEKRRALGLLGDVAAKGVAPAPGPQGATASRPPARAGERNAMGWPPRKPRDDR